MMDSTEIEAQIMIDKIKDSLKYKNRFIVDKDVNDLFSKCIKSKKTDYGKEKLLFRARAYTENDQFDKRDNYKKYKGNTWEGYDEKGSFVNLEDKWNPEGRMNPEGIKCLYTATNSEICLAEIKPFANTLISVAEIEILENLRMVDFSKFFGMGDTSFEASFFKNIDIELSASYLEESYLFPQYIAAYCKYSELDGLIYSSTFDHFSHGKNVAIFNYNKCRPKCSKLYDVSSVCIKGEFLDDTYQVGTQLAHKKNMEK